MLTRVRLAPHRPPVSAVARRRHLVVPRPDRARGRGQTLVEFALVFPIFVMLLLSVVEFAFLFEATLATNFASRNAALMAAEAGANTLADCAILAQIEKDLGAPNSQANIQSVTIYRADRAGNAISGEQNVYARGGPMTCTGFTPSTVPYGPPSPATYPVGEYPTGGRCDVLAGCTTTRPIDSIGVKIVYRYRFVTPLKNLVGWLPGASAGYFDVTWSNVLRMEPVL